MIESIAKVISIDELRKYVFETPIYIETKQSLRPAFFMRFVRKPDFLCKNEKERWMVNLMTPQKLTKNWECRLYNKTWRVWTSKPTREQQVEVMWE